VRVICVVGAHGVGKTTLCRLLAERLGVPFDEELGARLAADRRWRGPGVRPDAPQVDFDVELFRREMGRDDAARAPLRVVETWHPGNLAYAMRRSPSVAAEMLPALRERVAGTACCIPLLAPPEVLSSRAWEQGDTRYFDAVGHAAGLCAARLDIEVTAPAWTHADAPAAVLANALQRLEEARWTR
jgi:hypothetical protein